jgi:hypothetical protein
MKSLLLVTMLSVGTALTTMGRLKLVAASLTPPTSYDYSYTWNATDSEQYLNVNGVDSIPLYTRTADGIYFNYTNSFNVVDGLLVTQIFNRSNTDWQASGTFYKPDEDKIGSDNTVSNVSKFNITFDNQTKNNYFLYLDLSSTANYEMFVEYQYDSNPATRSSFVYFDYFLETRLYIPSFTSLNILTQNDAFASYFDAWYLEDLGISDSYQQGLDAETQGILTDYLGTDAQQIGWVLIGIAAILFAFKGGK